MAKRRNIARRPLTDAGMKARRAVPEVIADPMDASLELEPVTDGNLPDNPEMDVLNSFGVGKHSFAQTIDQERPSSVTSNAQ